MGKGPREHGTEFTAEVYRTAAKEHIPAARALYSARDFVLATYVAGLAVEAMFRAYRARISSEFDSRHDLIDLCRSGGFSAIFPAGHADEYFGYIDLLSLLWANTHRYRSEKSLRAKWKRMRLDRRVGSGDFVKELCRRAVDAADRIVSLGASQW